MLTPAPALFVLPAILTGAALLSVPRHMKTRAAAMFITVLLLSLALQSFPVTYVPGVLLLAAVTLLAAALFVQHAIISPIRRSIKRAGLKRRAEAHDEAHRTNFYNENPR